MSQLQQQEMKLQICFSKETTASYISMTGFFLLSGDFTSLACFVMFLFAAAVAVVVFVFYLSNRQFHMETTVQIPFQSRDCLT